MQYWDVFVVLTAVVALFATVLPFFTKLNRTLGELNATVGQMRETIKASEETRRATHKDIYNKLDDHEKRITRLQAVTDANKNKE